MIEEMNKDWFSIRQATSLPSPSLLVFPDRIATNIQHLLQIAGSPDRLWPHVKTYKMPQIVEMHLAAGIRRFKCATISEAEMLGRCGVDEVLLAYQPVGPNLQRLAQVVKHFPQVSFATLVDDLGVLQQVQAKFSEENLPLTIFLDLDSGMGRTGIAPGKAAHQLYRQIHEAPGLQVGGFHVYDGHFHQPDVAVRKAASDAAFVAITDFQHELEADGLAVPTVIAGGSPTFPVHALREGVSLSPGTYALWDAGYATICPELPFLPAAVLLTRVISKPGNNRLCLDLGHKAVAAENPLTHRLRFLNADIKQYLGQSEEHLIVEVEDPTAYPIGKELFAIPWHICPTVALHEQVEIIRDGELTEHWWVEARCRRLRF